MPPTSPTEVFFRFKDVPSYPSFCGRTGSVRLTGCEEPRPRRVKTRMKTVPYPALLFSQKNPETCGNSRLSSLKGLSGYSGKRGEFPYRKWTKSQIPAYLKGPFQNIPPASGALRRALTSFQALCPRHTLCTMHPHTHRARTTTAVTTDNSAIHK